ncbi:MAG: lysophospholipid acyltransferase family protein [Mesorhizobium sp.]
MKALRELSYANASQPRLQRWFIRSIEDMSGRDRFARLCDHWRNEIVPSRDRIFTRMLDLIQVGLDIRGAWPVRALPEGPLVIVANHPFGIGDGIAILSIAERLGRPFKVLINAELLKVPEMEGYSLAIDFSETKEALRNNMEVRHEALRLLKAGVTIVVFPSGGVATATKALGRAQDLPWKMFPARLIQDAKANVLPVHFSGQNGRLFHIVSQPMLHSDVRTRAGRALYKLSLTLRTSLLIREFARLSGRTIRADVGELIEWQDIEPIRDRKALIEHLHEGVFSVARRRAYA